MRGDPFSAAEQKALRVILDQLLGLDDIHGGWTSKIDARQTGFSLHIKFENKVSVQDALTAAIVFESANEKLCQIVARVIGQLDERNADAPVSP